jgi:hypothetical protein
LEDLPKKFQTKGVSAKKELFFLRRKEAEVGKCYSTRVCTEEAVSFL